MAARGSHGCGKYPAEKSFSHFSSLNSSIEKKLHVALGAAGLVLFATAGVAWQMAADTRVLTMTALGATAAQLADMAVFLARGKQEFFITF